MKYPYYVKVFAREGGGFQIFVHGENFAGADLYHAKNAEELLVFLMGVYDCDLYEKGYGDGAAQACDDLGFWPSEGGEREGECEAQPQGVE